MKALVGTVNQKKALVVAFSVIVKSSRTSASFQALFIVQDPGVEDVGWMDQLASLHKLPNRTLISHLDAYTTALYFTSSSLTTIGFGNVAANSREEKIFSIIIMFIGGWKMVSIDFHHVYIRQLDIAALMHATIFGNVATIISRMYSKRQEYEMKVLDLEHFVSVHKLPKNLKQRWIDMYAMYIML